MVSPAQIVSPERVPGVADRSGAVGGLGTRVPSATAVLVVAAGVALAACDRGTGMSPEVREMKVGAYSMACAAQELAARARDDEETLEATAAAVDPSTPPEQMALTARGAVLAFARAYRQHADLRASAYAYVDSAVNHSASPADSARYMQVASRFTIRTPMEGTVEANVMQNFERKMAEILTNADHPCNWDLPF